VEDDRAAASFTEQVAPSLALCARVGNIYTGSLYLGLTGLLDAQAASLVGDRIGLFSYGTGCTSQLFSGVGAPRASVRIAGAEIRALLAARARIPVEALHDTLALPGSAPPAADRSRPAFRSLLASANPPHYAPSPQAR